MAVAVGSLDAVAAFSGPSIALRAASCHGGLKNMRDASVSILAGPASLRRRERLWSAGAFELGMSAAGDNKKDWSPSSERDQAMGFLSAQAEITEIVQDAAGTKQVRAQLLAQQAREALDAAREAEEHAKNVKAKMSASSQVEVKEKTFSNGLSSMLNPVAMQMAADQGEYLRRCPIRQMQEDLTEIRCGVMNIVGNLGPQNLLALGVVLYAISVIQISN